MSGRPVQVVAYITNLTAGALENRGRSFGRVFNSPSAYSPHGMVFNRSWCLSAFMPVTRPRAHTQQQPDASGVDSATTHADRVDFILPLSMIPAAIIALLI